MYYRILIIAVLLLSFGCKNKSCDIPDEIAEIPIKVEIDRLEKPFYGADSGQEIVQFLNSNPLFANNYLQRGEYPADSILVGSL